jgi:4-carboxymuconolactone decarboxylase
MMLCMAAFAMVAGEAAAQDRKQQPAVKAPPDVRSLTPTLADYTENLLFGDVWAREGLSPRDRSLVTVSALIAGNKTAQQVGHIGRALDNGVKPSEITAMITHLAFYTGWPNAISAVGVAKEVFAKRGIPDEAPRPVAADLLPIDGASEATRTATVNSNVGPVAPGLAQYTNDILFKDLWRRPDLSARDRSLVTIAALIASGDAQQIGFHVERGMTNGLSRTEVSETITHLAFYAGWPKAMSAVPVAKAVFEAKEKTTGSAVTESSPKIEIMRNGSQPAVQAPAENFTGKVQVGSRFQRSAPARIGGAVVTFEPGARTAWHTHPLGQTLIVISGLGLVQKEGGPIESIAAGDNVWIPPGVKHWHGASPTAGMAHIAIAEVMDGKVVEWMEKVSDEQYDSTKAK